MSHVVELVGVLETGGERDPRLPRRTARTVRFPTRAPVDVVVDLFHPSGAGVDLAELAGWEAELNLWRGVDPCQRLPDLRRLGARPVGPRHRVLFSLASADTLRLEPGRYVFDVWLRAGADRWRVVDLSTAVVEPGLSRS